MTLGRIKMATCGFETSCRRRFLELEFSHSDILQKCSSHLKEEISSHLQDLS
jgi:hypothetical protein